MLNITKKELEAAYKRAQGIHKRHLAGEGVIMPNWGSAKAYWLAILIHAKGNLVHKDDISHIVRQNLPNAPTINRYDT